MRIWCEPQDLPALRFLNRNGVPLTLPGPSSRNGFLPISSQYLPELPSGADCYAEAADRDSAKLCPDYPLAERYGASAALSRFATSSRRVSGPITFHPYVGKVLPTYCVLSIRQPLLERDDPVGHWNLGS